MILAGMVYNVVRDASHNGREIDSPLGQAVSFVGPRGARGIVLGMY